MYWAGLCFYFKKDLDLARYYFEKINKSWRVKKPTCGSKIYNALGIVQQEKGELKKAIELLKKSILLRKQSTPSPHSIGEEDLQSTHHSLATTYSASRQRKR